MMIQQGTRSDVAVYGHGLSKVFNDFWGRAKVRALTDVAITVPSGCIFGLLGPNGAGKSTLIKLILGHLYPSHGRLSVLGQNPRDIAVKHQLGYQPERSHLYPSLTCQETLHYFGALHGLGADQIQARSQQLLDMVGLSRSGDRLVGEMSHGMNRRLSLAQALLHDPDLIILDEPTAGLDPVGCREVKDLIITLGKRGKTVILTSHLLADVEDVCDEIMLLFGGHVESHGKTSDLLENRERVTLEFPAIPETALAAVEGVLTQHVDAESIHRSAPCESLENYFLKAVARGNRDRETQGARMGKGVAEFLRDDAYEQHNLVEQLRVDTAPSDDPPPENSVDTEALANLANDSLSLSAEPTRDDSQPIDRDALDKLT